MKNLFTLDNLIISQIIRFVYLAFVGSWLFINLFLLYFKSDSWLTYVFMVFGNLPVLIGTRIFFEMIVMVFNIHDNIKRIADAVAQDRTKDICKAIDSNSNKVISVANEMVNEIIAVHKSSPQPLAVSAPEPVKTEPIEQLLPPPKATTKPVAVVKSQQPVKKTPKNDILPIMPELNGLILKVY